MDEIVDEQYDQGNLQDSQFSRSTQGNTFEDIYRQHYRQATSAIINMDSRRDLFEAERAIKILEMELALSMNDTEKLEIQDLRLEQKSIKPMDPSSKDKYAELLIERLEVILKVFGRKGLLPTKEADLEG